MDSWPLTLGDAREFARRTRAVAPVAWVSYYGATPHAVREGDQLSRLQRAQVSGDFFTVLGARPQLGRALRPEDDVFGAAPVLELSHRRWRERFGGTADVVGRQVVMHADGVAYRFCQLAGDRCYGSRVACHARSNAAPRPAGQRLRARSRLARAWSHGTPRRPSSGGAAGAGCRRG